MKGYIKNLKNGSFSGNECKNLNMNSSKDLKYQCKLDIIIASCSYEIKCIEYMLKILKLEKQEMNGKREVKKKTYVLGNKFWNMIESNDIDFYHPELKDRINAVSLFYKHVNQYNKGCEEFYPDEELESLFENILFISGILEVFFKDDIFLFNDIHEQAAFYALCKPDFENIRLRTETFVLKDPHTGKYLNRTMMNIRMNPMLEKWPIYRTGETRPPEYLIPDVDIDELNFNKKKYDMFFNISMVERLYINVSSLIDDGEYVTNFVNYGKTEDEITILRIYDAETETIDTEDTTTLETLPDVEVTVKALTTQKPNIQLTTQRPYIPATTQRPYNPLTTQKPYIPSKTTGKPYSPPATTQKPNIPSTTQKPNIPLTTQKPYSSSTTTQKPNILLITTTERLDIVNRTPEVRNDTIFQFPQNYPTRKFTTTTFRSVTMKNLTTSKIDIFKETRPVFTNTRHNKTVNDFYPGLTNSSQSTTHIVKDLSKAEMIPLEVNISKIPIFLFLSIFLNYCLYHSRYNSKRYRFILYILIGIYIFMSLWTGYDVFLN